MNFDIAHLSVDETEAFLASFAAYVKANYPPKFIKENPAD